MDIGRVNYERVAYGNPELQSHYDRYYGTGFEVPLFMFSQTLHATWGTDIISARHLGNFVFFAGSMVAFYVFLTALYGHPIYGLCGVLLLVATPRMFAESFYNSKDIAFLSVAIVLFWMLQRVRERSWLSLIGFGIVTGYAVSVRVQGLLFLPVCGAALFITMRAGLLQRLVRMAFYAGSSVLAAYAFIPVLWDDPVKNILGFLQSSAHPVGVPTLYLGSTYVSPAIPWHYHFVWIGITSLVSVVGTSLWGMAAYGASYIRHKTREDPSARVFIASLGIITGTLAVSVLLRPRTYDGWRHVYYVYPSMIVFSLFTLRALAAYRTRSALLALVRVAVFFVMAADVAFAVRFIARNHPFQYAYFNLMAGSYKRAKALFDMDYWGISYKQLYEYVVTHAPSSSAVYFDQQLPYTQHVIIPALMERGMRIVSSVEEADVYVAINRDVKRPPPQGFERAYGASVEGTDMSAVYVRRKHN